MNIDSHFELIHILQSIALTVLIALAVHTQIRFIRLRIAELTNDALGVAPGPRNQVKPPAPAVSRGFWRDNAPAVKSRSHQRRPSDLPKVDGL